MLFGYSSVTFVSDTIVRVSLRCHFPVCMFLRFGKAGWDCVTKGNIFICTHYFFFVFKYQSLPQRTTPEIRFSKPYSRYSLFFKHIWNSVRFLLNVERDEFGLRRRKASPLTNPVFTPLSVWHKNSSCIRGSLPLWNAFACQGSIPS